MVAPFFRLPFRPSPFRRETLHSLRYSRRAHRTSTASPDTTIEAVDAPMLKRVDGKYAASEGIAERSLHAQGKTNPRLGKMLFPSSSPSGPPASQDGNIKDAFQKGFSAKSSNRSPSSTRNTTGGLNALKTTNPLARISGNAAPNAPRFQSVCAPADPFKDEVHGKAWESFPSVEDDLAWLEENNDDLDLDLEIAQAPVHSLPTVQKPSPSLPSIASAGPAASDQKPIDVESSQGVPIPWSSSPPHHMQPPSVARADSGASITSTQSLKRKSIDEIPAESAPKRRSLPFPSKAKVQESEVITINDDDDVPVGRGTSAAKARRYDPLEATASAIKEQRKSHRLQRTQSAGPETYPEPEPGKPQPKSTDCSLEEIRDVVSSGSKAVEPIFLSTEQKQVLNLVTNKGQSVFFTGPAGTGKSVLMRSIITDLKKKWAKQPERLAVTASTGLAACNIGGITLHSFAGIGLGKEDVPTLVKKVRRNPKAKQRWLKTKCLIIDEISMVDGELFDKLNQIGRTIRNNGRPWGGIQLVITGDFFQLPPVPDSESRNSQFSFEASTWTTSIAHTIGLTQVFRQKDPQFAQMLNEMRLGKVSDDTVRAFKALERPLRFADGVEPTELFPTRLEVERSNQRRLNALDGKSYRFDATDSGDPKIKDRLLQNMMAPKFIDLKVGAQVMLIKNLDEQLCNGTIGKIKQFCTEAEWAGAGEGGRTTDDEPLDLERAVNKLKKFSHKEDTSRTGVPFPVVEFICTDGSHRTLQCVPDEWKVELPNGEIQAKRMQLPLILAWALSIHKAQGQTLERVKVDLTRTFEKGQAYVALSRATSQVGLQVLKFEKGKVMAHPKVVHFYNQLYSADQAVKGTAAASKVKKEESAPPPGKGKGGLLTWGRGKGGGSQQGTRLDGFGPSQVIESEDDGYGGYGPPDAEIPSMQEMIERATEFDDYGYEDYM